MIALLLGSTIFFAITTTILLALIVERIPATRLHLRRWRIAWSKRKQVSNAETKAKRAIEKMHREIEAAQTETRDRIRLAEIDANSRITNAEQKQKSSDAEALKAIQQVAQMGSFVVTERFGEISKTIKADNYHAKEKQVLKAVKLVAKNGYELPEDDLQQLARMLKQAHEKAKRDYAEKQRQAEIKSQIREEQREIREREKAIKAAEDEAKRKQQALEEALKLLGNTHSEELDQLRAELAEAQANAERAKSMAQMTKSGHVYIISNIGSFGDNVFKVGMTRRLEPLDRVKELSDASVPFEFDVHAMISCDDAPALENALHRNLETYRVNKVNLRKEFFQAPLNTIIDLVEEHHGKVEYQVDPEALEWRESIEIEGDNDDVESNLTAANRSD